MSDFDKESALKHAETWMSTELQDLISLLKKNGQGAVLFEHSLMDIWVDKVIVTGGGLVLNTVPGSNRKLIREIELNRMIGTRPLTAEGLVFRAALTGRWADTESFTEYLHNFVHTAPAFLIAQTNP